MLTVVAYYSLGTPYVAEVNRLADSAARLSIPLVVFPYQDRGDWYRNTAFKADFCLSMRDRIRGPMLYVDADAVFHEDPTAYFDGLTDDYDFAAHWFARQNPEFLSGTMWFNDTPAARKLIKAWVDLNTKKQQAGEWCGGGQINLAEVIAARRDRLRVHEMPGRFCYVFDHKQFYPADEPVVIEHLQASRENRDRRNRVNVSRRRRIAELAGLDTQPDGYWQGRYAVRGCYGTSGKNGKSAHHFYATGGDWRELIDPLMPRRNSNSVVLEYGCGMGRWVPYLLERHGAYVGLDVAQVPLDRCLAYYEDNAIQFHHADSIADIPAESIDTLFTCTALQHVVDDERLANVLRGLARVLKPRARVVMVENTTTGAVNNEYIAFRKPMEYVEIAAACGLRISSIAQHVDGERHTIFSGVKP